MNSNSESNSNNDLDTLTSRYLIFDFGAQSATIILLPKPLCIPQIDRNPASPFVRGTSEYLEGNIDLVSFIDGLNIAINASPPLRVVDVAAKGLGFVPFLWATIASTTIQAGARAGMKVLSKTLTDKYMRTANVNIFKKHGLAARLCTTAGMLQILSGTTSSPEQGNWNKTKDKLNSAGRSVGSTLLKLPLPIASRVIRTIADPAPPIAASDGALSPKEAMIQRRLAMVDGQSLPLNIRVPPPPPKPNGAWDTVQSWGVKFDDWTTERSESKKDSRRQKVERQRDVAAGRVQDATMRENIMARVQNRKAGRQGILTGLIGAREGFKETRVKNDDLIEHWANQKDVLWVVILNAEMDQIIAGVERADESANEEIVQQQAWDEEILFEEEEYRR